MTYAELVTTLARCPRCGGSLVVSGKTDFSCQSCGTNFPQLNHLTWLFADPHHAQLEWKNRFEYFLQMNQFEVSKLKLEQQGDGLLPSTKKRLAKLIQSRVEHGKFVMKALEPFSLVESGDPAIHRAAGTKLPPSQTLMSYYDNICRDWNYGQEENEICFQQLCRVIEQDDQLGVLGVLGSGACRLAYDIHRQCRVEATLNIDINPFLFYVAQRLVQGKNVNLYEFPMAPTGLDNVAVKLVCKAPEPIKEGFYFLLADAMNPSFQDQVFDTLLTPWLIDIVHQDLKEQARRYNRILKKGGRWLNFGSLAFFHPSASLCYSVEEVLEIIEASGFKLQSYSHDEIPYLHSPYSCQKRQEKVLCFSAEKVEDVKQPHQDFSMTPSWLQDTQVPVPLTPDLQQQTMVHQTIMSIFQLVDGKKSMRDMAREAGFLGLGDEDALMVIKNVLEKFNQQNLKNANF